MESQVSVADDDVLRPFYSRAVAILSPLLIARSAIISCDSELLASSFRECLAATDGLMDMVESAHSFKFKRTDWGFEFVKWWHIDDGQGDYPKPPAWPAGVPELEEAIAILKAIWGIRDFIQYKGGTVDQIGIELQLFNLTLNLPAIRNKMKAAEEGRDEDGPMDRNCLAKLLNLDSKTLANRANEMPEPIRRGDRGVPIYLYLDAKAALSKMYPDRAFMLPKYKEAVEKTKELSSEGNASRELP